MHCASASSRAPSSSALRICSSVNSMVPSGVRPDRSFSAASVSSGGACGSCAASSGVSCCRITGLFSCAVSAVSVLSVVSGSASSARPGHQRVRFLCGVLCRAPPGSPLRRALRPALRSSQTPRSVRQAARRLPAVPVPWVLPPPGALPCCPQRILPKKPPPRSVSSRRALFSAPVPSRSAAGRWAAPSQPPAGSARFMADPRPPTASTMAIVKTAAALPQPRAEDLLFQIRFMPYFFASGSLFWL